MAVAAAWGDPAACPDEPSVGLSPLRPGALEYAFFLDLLESDD